MTLGIVDVGTNSTHLLVGVVGLRGQFYVILKERDLTRLGEGGLAKGALTPAAMHRAIEVLKRFAVIMKRCRVDHVEAVATSAVREASNGPAFVRRVREKTGVPLRIISGREEARLIYLGVAHTNHLRQSTALITIGGGSLQIMVGSGSRLRYLTSLPLGCARLAQQFIHHDPPKPDELRALDAMVRRTLAPSAQTLTTHRWSLAVGSSATIAQLMMANYLQSHAKPPRDDQQLAITDKALRQLVDWLADSSADQRIQLAGLDPRREDLALATGITLLAWMELCGVKTLRYAPGSLREGLVVHYWIAHHLGKAPRFQPSTRDMVLPKNGKLLKAVKRRAVWRLPELPPDASRKRA